MTSYQNDLGHITDLVALAALAERVKMALSAHE